MTEIKMFIGKLKCFFKAHHDYRGDRDMVLGEYSEEFKRGHVWFIKCKSCGQWQNQEWPYHPDYKYKTTTEMANVGVKDPRDIV